MREDPGDFVLIYTFWIQLLMWLKVNALKVNLMKIIAVELLSFYSSSSQAWSSRVTFIDSILAHFGRNYYYLERLWASLI